MYRCSCSCELSVKTITVLYKTLSCQKQPYQTVHTAKPVLSGHSKIDKTKILMTNGSLMKVESIAESSNWEHSAILLTCIKR